MREATDERAKASGCPVIDIDYRVARPAFETYQSLNEVREQARGAGHRVRIHVPELGLEHRDGARVLQVAEHQCRLGVGSRLRAAVLARPGEVGGILVLRDPQQRLHRRLADEEERERALGQERHPLPLENEPVLQRGDGQGIADLSQRDDGLLGEQRRSGRKARYQRRGALTLEAKRGLNELRFSGKIGKKALKPGSYRAELVARAASGVSSVPRRLAFRIVKP